MTASIAMKQDTAQWIEVGRIEEIPRLGARVVQAPEGNIAVFRNNENEIFALLVRCPHKGGPLSQGIIYGRTVTCPLHNWCMHLDTGTAVAPDEGCVASFPVKIENGVIFLGLRS